MQGLQISDHCCCGNNVHMTDNCLTVYRQLCTTILYYVICDIMTYHVVQLD
jgi:hypothetical protein